MNYYRAHPPHEDKISAVNHIKAKIVRLYSARLARGNIELQDSDVLQTERTTLYQLIKRRRPRVQRTITSVYDAANGRTATTTRGVVNAFCNFLQRKYSPLPANEESIRHMAEAGFLRLPEGWRDTLGGPLTADELRALATATL